MSEDFTTLQTLRLMNLQSKLSGAEDLIKRSTGQSDLKSSTSRQILIPKPELRTFWEQNP